MGRFQLLGRWELSRVSVVKVCPTCGGSGLVDLESGHADVQTQAARDHTASDQDQTLSDLDQTSSDRDARSAAEDQEASDQDVAAGGDVSAHERTRLQHESANESRRTVSDLHDETAASRGANADERDRAAEERDHEADERDRIALDLSLDAGVPVESRLLRAESDRVKAAADRLQAADHRARAAVDRARAARERSEALLAEAEVRHELLVAGTDVLTGVWTRRAGLANINREVERARRTEGSLVLIFVDVDGLKEVNDTLGHPAGDELLRVLAETLRANIRPYDIVTRYGGDEFLCAMPNLTLTAARERLERVALVMAAREPRHSIGFGLAECDRAEQLDDLISRADADLLASRASRKA